MRPFILIVLLALNLTACSDDLTAAEDNFSAPDVTGVVHVPLAARGADGKTYRLRNATFEITGAAMFTVGDRDAADADADSLATTLPAGGYSLYLRPGWQLVERSAEGKDVPAQANLASTNPMTFEIGRTLDARVTLIVHTGEQDLVFGATGPMKITSVDTGRESAL